ncbi:MAG: MFS transporter [Alphaproteobacteria bacterium]|nr:MFS transporter [Alphaproteobacteria bacterium]
MLPKKQRSVQSTLRLLKIGMFFNYFMLITPVIILVYINKGITLGDFFLIQGLFRLAAFLFEIPSGYLSDRFSRRHVLIFGVTIHLIGYATLAIAYGFWQIVMGEALLGVASALFSGTLEAYTYDLLKRNHTQKHFLKEFGSIRTYIEAASFIAALLGGYLFAKIGGNALLWVEALLCIISLTTTFMMPELSEVKRKKPKNKSNMADAVGITIKTLRKPKLRNLIIFPSFFGAFTIILFWILQPVMEKAHVPVALFGFFTALNGFSSILFSKYAHIICKKLGEIKTSVITILSIFLSVSCVFVTLYAQNMFIVYIACTIMGIVPAIRQLNNLQYNALIHDDITSNERGTVLSTRAMVSTLFGAGMLTCAKFLLDTYGIETTMIFTLFMTVFLFWSLKNVKKYLKK